MQDVTCSRSIVNIESLLLVLAARTVAGEALFEDCSHIGSCPGKFVIGDCAWIVNYLRSGQSNVISSTA